MKRQPKPAIVLFLTFISVLPTTAQRNWQPSRELAIGGACALWSGINYTFQFTSPQIPTGRNWNFGKIDATAQFSLNKRAKTFSDITAAGTAVLSGLAVLNKDKNLSCQNLVIITQSAWISVNLAHSVKMIAKRNRPYTQATGFTFSKRNEVYSFFSGHTALVASLFTSALLLQRAQGNTPVASKWFLGAAGATAATTMVLRIAAGKHYPTDIITGLIAGFGVAFINYKIHEK